MAAGNDEYMEAGGGGNGYEDKLRGGGKDKATNCDGDNKEDSDGRWQAMARTRRLAVAGNGEDDKAVRGNCKDYKVGGCNDGQDNEAAGNGKDKGVGGDRRQSGGQGGQQQGQLVGQRRRQQER